ncbi:MAG: hypothetical protein KAJ93_07160 [Methanosarcinales archaeon]|nr:hypothetical protein [Methanosarcinales archaeon]
MTKLPVVSGKQVIDLVLEKRGIRTMLRITFRQSKGTYKKIKTLIYYEFTEIYFL